MARTLNWISRHVNTDHVRCNVTVLDAEGDAHGKDLTCTSPAVLAAAKAFEDAVCAEASATIIEPPKKEEAKAE